MLQLEIQDMLMQPLHSLAKRLVWYRRRNRRPNFDDGGLAVDYDWLRVIAQELTLAVVRVVELAEACILDRALRLLEKMAWCAWSLD